MNSRSDASSVVSDGASILYFAPSGTYIHPELCIDVCTDLKTCFFIIYGIRQRLTPIRPRWRIAAVKTGLLAQG